MVTLKAEDYEVAFNRGGWLQIAPTGNHRITKVFAQCALSCDHRFRDDLGYGEDFLKGSIKAESSRKIYEVSQKCGCMGGSLATHTQKIFGSLVCWHPTERVCVSDSAYM